MTVGELFQKLLAAFPRSKLTDDESALYLEKLGHLKPDQRERAFDSAVERHRYKSMPTIAELLGWGQGKEPGKGRAKDERGKWPPVERQRQVSYSDALRNGSSEERAEITERSNARLEALRRSNGNPVMSSQFAGCICTRESHPHSLEEALIKHGLDARGEPLQETDRKPWEETMSAQFNAASAEVMWESE